MPPPGLDPPACSFFFFHKIQYTILLEGVHSIAPAKDVEDLIVDAHRDGEAHDSEGDSGDHSDDAELEQGQQAHHQPS